MKDTIVLGGGLMGSAVAWQLTKDNQNVTLIEQQAKEYSYGSSFGISRIARQIGSKEDIFSFLQIQSVAEAKELVRFLNSIDSESSHSMEDVYTKSPVSYLFDERCTAERDAICHPQQTTSYDLANTTNSKDILGMNLPKGISIIREYADCTGTINPKALMAKLHQGIKAKNGKILYNHKVINISKEAAHYNIEILDKSNGKTNIITAKKIVTALGAYTGDSLKTIAPTLKDFITPKRVFSTFFKIKPSIYETLSPIQKSSLISGFPVYCQYDDMFYAMVDTIDNDGIPILKSGAHAVYQDITSLDNTWKSQPDQSYIDWNQNELCQYLKMLNISIDFEDLEYISGQSCVYSLTSSGIPIVSRLEGEDIVVIAGMNGIGAKGSLCYGLIAKDILLGKSNDEAMYQKTRNALGLRL